MIKKNTEIQGKGTGKVQNFQDVLVTMAKAIDTYSVRSYGTVLAIREQRVAYTNGFVLLEYRPAAGTEYALGEDRCLGKNLLPKDCNYPAYAALLPDPGSLPVRLQDHTSLAAILEVLAPKAPHVTPRFFVELLPDRARVLVPGEKPLLPTSPIINPFMLQHVLKGIPKDAVLETVLWKNEEDPVLFRFQHLTGEFHVIVVPIRQPKEDRNAA